MSMISGSDYTRKFDIIGKSICLASQVVREKEKVKTNWEGVSFSLEPLLF